MSISTDPQQLFIEYRSFERLYLRTRIIFGVLVALGLLLIGSTISQSLMLWQRHDFNGLIIAVSALAIIVALTYTVARSYWKSVTLHEHYKALKNHALKAMQDDN